MVGLCIDGHILWMLQTPKLLGLINLFLIVAACIAGDTALVLVQGQYQTCRQRIHGSRVELGRLYQGSQLTQLNKSVYYRKLPADPTSEYITEVRECVDSMYQRKLIDMKTRKFLAPQYPRAARFYLLPKIHKPGNPGRPIVASNGALAENISRFVDFFL